MEVTVDGVVIDDTFLDAETTIEHALKHVQQNLCSKDHLVVGIHCDGEDVPAQKMAETLQQPAQTYDRLEVITGTRGELVESAMTQAAYCLSNTEEACQRTASMLTEGKTVDAAETLGECLRIWQQVHEAVAKSIEMLQINPDQVRVNDGTLTEMIGKPKEVLIQMRGALHSQDFVLLADILEYEFAEVTQVWFSIVNILKEQAEARKLS